MTKETKNASDPRSHFKLTDISIAKSERDVATLKKHARFVIALEDTGEFELISNPPHKNESEPVVPLIAVVARVEYKTKRFWASVAEIGYGRARPYRRVHVNQNKVLLQSRHPSWQLTARQLQRVYPTLLECLELVLTETRSRWKSDQPWIINGRAYEKGVQITVNQEDRFLCQAMLRENLRYFGVFSRSVDWINWQLRHSKFDVYGVNQYGPNVRRVAESVVYSVFAKDPFWLEVLLRHVGKRRLLENALAQLHGFIPEPSVELAIAFDEPQVTLPSAEGLFVWHTFDQPSNRKGSHADGCSRFEVLFDRRNPNSRGTQDGEFYSPRLTKEMMNDPDFCPF